MRTIAALILLFGLAPLAQAQTCKTPSADCVVVGDWDLSVSLGAGARTNPVKEGDEIPLVVLPQISYYGERFFLENLDLGVTLFENEGHTFNLLASPGYDRVFFVRNDLQNYFINGLSGAVVSAPPSDAPSSPNEFPIRERKTTYFTGLEWLFYTGRITGQVDALYEATGRHKGYEVRSAFAAPLVVGEQQSLVLSGGFTWKSDETVDYYYGVDGFYEPGDAFNPFVKLGYSRPLSERLTLTAFVHYERLDSAIVDSPIVEDGDVSTAFVGVQWKVL